MAKKDKLVKRLYVYSEMAAAGVWPPKQKPDQVDELLLSLAHKEGGCEWEFGIELIVLQRDHGAMRLRVFSDAWRAFEEAPEVFKVLSMFRSPSGQDDRKSWPLLIEALQRVGWKKVKPEPHELPKPLVCEACGRP